MQCFTESFIGTVQEAGVLSRGFMDECVIELPWDIPFVEYNCYALPVSFVSTDAIEVIGMVAEKVDSGKYFIGVVALDL